jgi:hypothetical protein
LRGQARGFPRQNVEIAHLKGASDHANM